ncbi:MAG TPA: hypothetical protein VGC62_13305 [Pseudomonas sp.]|uniref:hypothetical protein n=1 Tax=Pseudomonas sp. TaxID=306 RepID=UPI002ED97090
MTREVTLHVSFPRFGNNYYSQHVIARKTQSLVSDNRFDSFLMPAATNHFSNEVIGLTDQFRFLNDILASHLSDVESSRPAHKTRRALQNHLI